MSKDRMITWKKTIVRGLLVANIIFGASALIATVGIVQGLYCLLPAISDELSMRFLLVGSVQALFGAISVLLFTRVVSSVRKGSEFFSREQSKRMLAIGCFLFLRFILGFFIPSLDGAIRIGLLHDILSPAPTADLSTLSFAVMFFALAGIFEYGRLLQEDTDSIL